MRIPWRSVTAGDTREATRATRHVPCAFARGCATRGPLQQERRGVKRRSVARRSLRSKSEPEPRARNALQPHRVPQWVVPHRTYEPSAHRVEHDVACNRPQVLVSTYCVIMEACLPQSFATPRSRVDGMGATFLDVTKHAHEARALTQHEQPVEVIRHHHECKGARTSPRVHRAHGMHHDATVGELGEQRRTVQRNACTQVCTTWFMTAEEAKSVSVRHPCSIGLGSRCVWQALPRDPVRRGSQTPRQQKGARRAGRILLHGPAFRRSGATSTLDRQFPSRSRRWRWR